MSQPVSHVELPQSDEAERSVLGAVLVDNRHLDEVSDVLRPDDFYRAAHQRLFRSMLEMAEESHPIDVLTLGERHSGDPVIEAAGGVAFLSRLMDGIPKLVNVRHYASIVRDRALRRQLVHAANELVTEASLGEAEVQDVLGSAARRIADIGERQLQQGLVPMKELLEVSLDDIEKRQGIDSTITGVPTGFAELDELTSGLQKGDLVILAARPSMGKCVAWDTRILDADTGELRTAADLHAKGMRGERVAVMSLDERGRLVRTEPSAFVDDGVRPVFRVRTRLGREVTTTAGHPFLTGAGWTRLHDLSVGDRIAVPRALPTFGTLEMPEHELVELARSSRANPARLPSDAFRLSQRSLAVFLDRLFAEDVAAGGARLAFATSSEELARDVQHLLLRFGIVSKLCEGRGFEVELPGSAATPSPHGDQLIPSWSREITARGFARRSSGSPAMAGVAIGREQPAAAALAPNLATSDVLWDEIVAIEPKGDQQVYDLTIPVHHNFVANDVLVHNTSFAMSMAQNAAIRSDKKIAVFSLEMSAVQLAMRVLCAEARVDAQKMRRGQLTDLHWNKLMKAFTRLAQAPIYIDETSAITVQEMRAKAKRLQQDRGLDCIMVDYLQLMGSSDRIENRQQEISTISRGLKKLAHDLKVPVVALSQLSRAPDQRQGDHRPMLSDLRESGSLEQDADVVMFIYREEVYKLREGKDPGDKRGVAEIIIGKQRNGPVDTVKLAFIKEWTRFENLQREGPAGATAAPPSAPEPDDVAPF